MDKLKYLVIAEDAAAVIVVCLFINAAIKYGKLG